MTLLLYLSLRLFAAGALLANACQMINCVLNKGEKGIQRGSVKGWQCTDGRLRGRAGAARNAENETNSGSCAACKRVGLS